MEKAKPYQRERQVIETLYRHGAMSNRGLKKVLYPPIKPRRIANVTHRLCENGWLVKRFKSLPENAGNYYQLSQKLKMSQHIRVIIGHKFNPKHEPNVHYRELFHSEDCAVWTTELERLFPDAQVLREWEIVRDQKAMHALLLDYENLHTIPDLILTFKGLKDRDSVNIALEVERSRKSNKRTLKKLKSYSTGTGLDGVIYLVTSDNLAGIIKRLYWELDHDKNCRVGHYRKNFLMFIVYDKNVDSENLILLNSELKPVSLSKWITYLRSKSRNTRRDFEMSDLT